MAYKCLNFFDDLERMRTRTASYEPGRDYSSVLWQLTYARRKFCFNGLSPQNLASPVDLLPVVVVSQGSDILRLIDPVILATTGEREQYESCGNIYLVHGRRKIYPIVRTSRPVHAAFTAANLDGQRTRQAISDSENAKSVDGSVIGVLFHEIDHLYGRLIVDIARDRLAHLIHGISTPKIFKVKEKVIDLANATNDYIRSLMPLVIVREGDSYIVHHGSEFEGAALPEISADAIMVDGFFGSVKQIRHIYVPRDGELIPIKASSALLALRS